MNLDSIPTNDPLRTVGRRNIRKGLLRLWIVATAGWVVYSAWAYYQDCGPIKVEPGSPYKGGFVCGDLIHAAGGFTRLFEPSTEPYNFCLNLMYAAALGLRLPLVILGCGLALTWVVRGFELRQQT